MTKKEAKPASVEIREHFLEFVPTQETTGASLAKSLLEILEKNSLNLENLRGQGYDNAANMKGKHNGVQRQILDMNPRAFLCPVWLTV